MANYVGQSLFRLVTANTENETLIKGTGGKIERVYAVNVTAAPIYIKLFDKKTVPVNGTDVPVMTLQIPASGSLDFDPKGFPFSKGLGISVVTTAPDTGTTGPVAGAQIIHVFYK